MESNPINIDLHCDEAFVLPDSPTRKEPLIEIMALSTSKSYSICKC
jgi:hypothetical protein